MTIARLFQHIQVKIVCFWLHCTVYDNQLDKFYFSDSDSSIFYYVSIIYIYIVYPLDEEINLLCFIQCM